MVNVLITGVSVVDFIFQLNEIPKENEKFRAENASISGGGIAANAAVAISRLGGTPTLVSRLGYDQIGSMIKNDLIEEGVNVNFTKQFQGNRSSFSSVYIDKKGDRQVVNYRDKNLPDDASWINEIDEHDAYLADTRWNEGAVETLKIAKGFKRPGVLDAEETVSIEAIKNASHIAFSLYGLQKFTKQKDIKYGLIEISKITSGWVCVTNGEKGVFFLQNSELINIPSKQVEVKDTLGAGDVWHGAFTLSLAEGNNEINSIKFANSAATLKCTVFGGRNGFPNRKQLNQFMMENEINAT